MMKFDRWQEEVLKTQGNICLRSGRQVGKSTVIGYKAAKYALQNRDKLIMVISKTERQSGLLFSKILLNLHEMAKSQIKGGKDRPTKHKVTLRNGSVIHCLPAGDTGYGIMGFTIDLLIADEAAFIPEEVWNSIIPALAITRGAIWLLSTPYLKEGYYYECFKDPTFTSFHTSSEDCPRKDQEFLDQKKKVLTKAQYAQMYLGEFVDNDLRFFPEELIEKCCVLDEVEFSVGDYYLGCDVARMDKDEFSYEIVKRINEDEYIHVYDEVTTSIPLPQSARHIMDLNRKYDFIKEYIDSGGMGISICDMLREDDDNKRKVVEINNASRIWNKDNRMKKIMKEELYHNLKTLMEQDKIKILKSMKNSLRSVLAEHHKETGRLKIWGKDTHKAEGLVRAAWGSKDKSLKIWIY